MPSRRVEQLINSMTDQEYREAEEAYDSFHPEADSMSFEEYMSEPEFEEEFEEELEAASRGSRGGGVLPSLGRSHYVGSRMPYEASRMPLANQDRDHHASGPSYGHGNLHPTGRGGGYEAHSHYESSAGEFGGVRAGGGRGGPGPSLPSEVSSSHGTGSLATGGNRPCCGAPPPSFRTSIFRSTLLGRTSSFSDVGSHSHGNQQYSHSQDRYDGYGSHGGSTDRSGGRRNPANDRQS